MEEDQRICQKRLFSLRKGASVIGVRGRTLLKGSHRREPKIFLHLLRGGGKGGWEEKKDLGGVKMEGADQGVKGVNDSV